MNASIGHAFVPGKTDTTHGPAGTWCAVMVDVFSRLGPRECGEAAGAHNLKPAPSVDRATRLRAIAALHRGSQTFANPARCDLCGARSPCPTWTIAADPLWEGEA